MKPGKGLFATKYTRFKYSMYKREAEATQNVLLGEHLMNLRYTQKRFKFRNTSEKEKYMHRRFVNIILCTVLSLTLLLSSCTAAQPSQTAPTIAVTSSETTVPTEPAPRESAKLVSVEVKTNPSTDPAELEDPFADINHSHLNQELSDTSILLYNDLFRAALDHKKSFDLSPYPLSFEEKNSVFNLLISESFFRLSHMTFVYCSEDESEAIFSYHTYNKEQFDLRQETLSARLGQILYNVVPEGATDLQTYAALYQYVCEMSNYAPDIIDAETMGPDSILINKVGICWGFSEYMAYLLPKFGISCDYVDNTTHAWNQIVIDGELYHSDVTFGTGMYESTSNSFETFLMNDEKRNRSLEMASVELTKVYLNHQIGDDHLAPECTSDRFSVYGSIYDNYALDIPNNRVYVCDDGRIKTMNLDGSNLTTILKSNAFSPVCFDGEFYYLSLNNNHLYHLGEDGKGELVDGNADYNYLRLEEATLYYSVSWDGEDAIELHLVPDREQIEASGSLDTLPAQDIQRCDSCYFEVKFDRPMDTSADWSQLAILTDDGGNPLATRLIWDEKGTTLIVRPSYSVDEYTSVSFYVLAGAPTIEGGTLPAGKCLPVNIHSVADVAPGAEQTEDAS